MVEFSLLYKASLSVARRFYYPVNVFDSISSADDPHDVHRRVDCSKRVSPRVGLLASTQALHRIHSIIRLFIGGGVQ